MKFSGFENNFCEDNQVDQKLFFVGEHEVEIFYIDCLVDKQIFSNTILNSILAKEMKEIDKEMVRLAKRKKELEECSLDYFPILLLCLKGNNNVKKAISLANDQVNNSLSKEFERVIRDVKIGKSLDEALTLMKDRIPSTYIVNIIVNLIEANRMGNSVSDSMNDQLDYIENKRKNKIIKYHKLMPLKVGLTSIVFVFMVLLFLIFCTM